MLPRATRNNRPSLATERKTISKRNPVSTSTLPSIKSPNISKVPERDANSLWPTPWLSLDPDELTGGIVCDDYADDIIPAPGIDDGALDFQLRALSELDSETPSTNSCSMNGHWDSQPTNPKDGSLEDFAQDGVEREMEECTRLNLAIYRMIRRISYLRVNASPPPLPATDEIIEMTTSFLKILSSVTTREKRADSANVASPASDFLCLDLEGPLRSHSIDPSLYLNDGVCGEDSSAPDMGTLFSLIACHQRLLDLFKHVCLSLHLRISQCWTDPSQESTAPDAETTLALGEREPATKFGDLFASDSTNAQAVMVLELIMHLLHRLDRGQRQLAALISSEGQPAHPRCSISSTTSGESRIHGQNVLDAATDTRGYGSSGVFSGGSCSVTTRAAIEIMAQKQIGLRVHVETIKQLIRNADDL
ncbi:hypothetical protein F5X96DRAFT_638300 [Biscogniauxia mediterranea]|nr:hypothetical protein F5X96DRAFT_638300 [Biscogniauxia mediterranea]